MAGESLVEYVFGKVVERRSSKISGELEVWSQYGKYVLHSKEANYSFDTLHRAFQNVFRQIGLRRKKLDDILILGFGAGSVANIIRQEIKSEAQITGVELDPEVIDLARKYFNLDSYNSLSIVNADAFEFVSSCNSTFALVISDVFIDKTVPEKFLENDYVEELVRATKPGGLGIMNIIVETKHMKRKLIDLVSCFEKQGVYTRVLKVSGINRMIIWEKM